MGDRVLIFGGSGMLGHKLTQVLSKQHETFVTLRDKELAEAYPAIFSKAKVIDKVDAQDQDSISRAFAVAQPDVVVNCIGVVKQLDTSKNAVISIAVNSLFPHLLAEHCADRGARLVTVSTDCVFSGAKGNYTESDTPEPHDLYGRSKMLGEVSAPNCLTIRTSIIGRQIHGSHALLEWFLQQRSGKIKGYRKAIFTGFPTLILSEIISEIIDEHKELEGITHIAADPISKFDLLGLINEVYKLDVEIEADDILDCNRALNANRFRSLTGMKPDSWKAMIEKMKEDDASYSVPARMGIKQA